MHRQIRPGAATKTSVVAEHMAPLFVYKWPLRLVMPLQLPAHTWPIVSKTSTCMYSMEVKCRINVAWRLCQGLSSIYLLCTAQPPVLWPGRSGNRSFTLSICTSKSVIPNLKHCSSRSLNQFLVTTDPRPTARTCRPNRYQPRMETPHPA